MVVIIFQYFLIVLQVLLSYLTFKIASQDKYYYKFAKGHTTITCGSLNGDNLIPESKWATTVNWSTHMYYGLSPTEANSVKRSVFYIVPQWKNKNKNKTEAENL